MPINKPINQFTYTAAEVCRLVGISKSTLLRWEREGLIDPVQRLVGSSSSQRSYTQEDLRALCKHQRLQLTKKFEANKENKFSEDDVYEALYLLNFVEGKPTSLEELKSHPQLSPPTMKLMLELAERYEPNDPVFTEIMEILFVQSRKLSQKANADMEANL